MSDEGMSDAPRYLLIKRGLYYRPNNQGYTGKRSEAGRYPETDADDMSGVTAVHEDNAAEYAPACWQETINQDLRERLDAAEREREAFAERVFRHGFSDGWTANQKGRLAASASVDEAWHFYVADGALQKSVALTANHSPQDQEQ